ncbi:nucleotidyl transferase AbiEii/AbiGii toxin family protein [Candidatus Margulisiibacteriota bacterium]
MLEYYYYEKEFKALNKNNIKYLVIGGIAVNLYGLHRLTQDLDMMLNLSAENFDTFIKVMGQLNYKTKVPKSDWKKHDGIAFRNSKEPDRRIDILLNNPIDFEQAYKRKKIFKIDGRFSVPCVSLDDLIKMKEKADRTRDLIDIGSLKRMHKLNET